MRQPRRLPIRALGAALGLALLSASCHGPSLIGPKAVRLGGWLHSGGTRLLDARGRPVRLNGVGVRNFVTVGVPGTDCPAWQSPGPQVAQNIADWGYNSVRIPLAWANLEPNPPIADAQGTLTHQWDGRYLSAVDRFVQELGRRGIGVVFTFHVRFGLDQGGPAAGCKNASVPSWMYPDGLGDPSAAKCDFLQDHTQQGAPEDIWKGFTEAWKELAQHYASNPAVIGADMVNEPYAQNGICQPKEIPLGSMYSLIGRGIRSANPHLLLIFEDSPPGFAQAGKFEIDGPPPFDGVVYSFHVYQPNWTPAGQSVTMAYWDRARRWNVPLFVGEFNAFGYSAPGTPYDPNWERDTGSALRFWRQQGISWMIWAYSGGNHIVEKDGSPRADLIRATQLGF